MLTLAKSNQDDYRFTCASCPYEYPMRGKQVGQMTGLQSIIHVAVLILFRQYVETNYLTRKQADDVLGGEDSWKNVDSIEGESLRDMHVKACI